jgi:ribosome-binding factor A
MSMRKKRVGEEIKKVISERLVRGLKDPVPGFVTIQDVEVNRDFSRAKVFFSVFGSDAQKVEAGEVLNQYARFFRSEVNKAIRLRNSPLIEFVYDDTPDRAARIHALLGEQQDEGDSAEDKEG